MKYLFFDTETNGLPKNWKAPITEVDNWPRIIQFAYILMDKDQNVLCEDCKLIAPDGWTIPDEKFWKDNGYSTERNAKEGVSLDWVFDDFIDCIQMSNALVAHNMAFDYSVVGAEMIRYKRNAGVKLEKICTMKSSIDLCKLPPVRYGSFKFPKLEELHQHLFGCSFDGAHDALEDVRATARCFFEMKKLGVELKF